MQGQSWFPILPKICPSLLGHCYFLGLLYVRYAIDCSRALFQDFKPNFDHSNALQRTFTGSTLPFAVACASPVRRKSDVDFLRRDFGHPNHELFAVLSTRLLFIIDALT